MTQELKTKFHAVLIEKGHGHGPGWSLTRDKEEKKSGFGFEYAGFIPLTAETDVAKVEQAIRVYEETGLVPEFAQ